MMMAPVASKSRVTRTVTNALFECTQCTTMLTLRCKTINDYYRSEVRHAEFREQCANALGGAQHRNDCKVILSTKCTFHPTSQEEIYRRRIRRTHSKTASPPIALPFSPYHAPAPPLLAAIALASCFALARANPTALLSGSLRSANSNFCTASAISRVAGSSGRNWDNPA